MTKKNLAALMLAGAMMTVGSGAMAEAVNSGVSITSDITEGVATVTATYTAAEDINITISWTNPSGVTYSWENGAWVAPETGNVEFDITNKGSKQKKVEIINSKSPAWINAEADTTTTNTVNVDPKQDTTDGTGKIKYSLGYVVPTGDDLAGFGNKTDQSDSLEFTVKIGNPA